MDRGAWRATVHGVAESNITEQLTFQQDGKKVQKSCSSCIVLSVKLVKNPHSGTEAPGLAPGAKDR